MTTRLLVATRSEGKLRELTRIFASHPFELVDLRAAGIERDPSEDDIECFDTFEENAVAKARYFHARSSMPTIADDSGLEVRALNGRPGVHSKRWTGQSAVDGQELDDANNAHLVRSIEGMRDRGARYVCAAAYVDAQRVVVRRGEVAGRIALHPSGNNGFGYDPYFLADELGVSFACASSTEKDAISHRGRAFRALLEALRIDTHPS